MQESVRALFVSIAEYVATLGLLIRSLYPGIEKTVDQRCQRRSTTHNQMFGRARYDGVSHARSCCGLVFQFFNCRIRRKTWVDVPSHRHYDCPERSIQRPPQAAGQPVISVDTKKKELVGNFKNGGSDYRPKGDPCRVNVHDFEDKELGKVVPYGVYDVTANAGFVSVGITSDTAEFAVQSIRCWLERMGRERYPEATELTITADCGGSNGARVRLWKVELQKLADETGLVLHVHHYPPGTSKWNKIEHRLFCHITQNWRGRPLTDRIAVVELIGATTTKAGLKVACALDTRIYQKGIKIKDAEMAALAITGDAFHPDWNYTINPRPR